MLNHALKPALSRKLEEAAYEVHLRHSAGNLEQIKIYFAHALTGVSARTLLESEEIKGRLCSRNHIPMHLKHLPEIEIDPFHGLGELPPEETVIGIDLLKAISCDLLVCLHVAPSYGVGAEVHLRSYFGLPTLFLVRDGEEITRFMTQLREGWGSHVHSWRYHSAEGAVRVIWGVVMSLWMKSQQQA